MFFGVFLVLRGVKCWGVKAGMRVNTQRTAMGEGMRQEGRGKDKTIRNRDIRRSVAGRAMGWGTWGIQDGHDRDFQEGKQGI